MEALSDDTSSGDDDSADHGIGVAQAPAAFRQREGARHEAPVLGRDEAGVGHDSVTRASTKALGSNGWRSSMPSPTPTSLIGTPSSLWMRTTMPPLAVPSSLVRTNPVNPTAAWNILACSRPF